MSLPPNTALIHDAARGRWLWFTRPHTLLAARTPNEVIPLLEAIERAVEIEGQHAAGFVTYEASPAFDPALETLGGGTLPLAWFGLFDAPRELAGPDEVWGGRPYDEGKGEPAAEIWAPSIDAARYRAAVGAVREHIARGDTYQVNLSFRLRASIPASPEALFARMIGAQGPGYGALIAGPDWSIASASPELFFRLDGERLSSRPMKGTARRGLWAADDRARAAWLAASEKNRAENVMIVDMVRHDMGRIARVGSVRVDELFALEQYPTVWQMTSQVTCATTAGLTDLFRALFPPASITGAPKARTMQIIAALEDSPRQIYTGTIGYAAPGRRAQFNVAIRTAWIDHGTGETEYGVGGGIVWDSTDRAELDEAYAKAAVLTVREPAFSLLETMRWEAGRGIALLEEHLARLRASAAYFDVPYDEAAIRDALGSLAGRPDGEARRVRLTLGRDGELALEDLPLPAVRSAPYRLALARTPVNAEDRFLYHKTTHRAVYERARAAWPEHDDVLLWNERGEITESCIANVILEEGGRRYTPPLESGLLPGVGRGRLLAEKAISERAIRVEELAGFSAVYLVNALRGLWRAELDPATLRPG